MTADESGAQGAQDARGLGALAHRSARPPLSREEVLEHALRELVARADPSDVGLTIDDLREPMGSVLDFRAADEIDGMADHG